MPTDLKPSAATNASALDGTERIPCTQGGNSRAATPAQIKTYVGALEQGAGDTIADNELVRGDTDGLQGSPVLVTDAGRLESGDTFAIDVSRATDTGFFEIKRGDLARYIRLGPSLSGQQTIRSSNDRLLIQTDDGVLVLDISNAFGVRVHGTDWGWDRVAAGVGKVTDGGGGYGWEQWAGQSYAAADLTNDTTTMAAVGLSVTVKSGRRYGFKLILFLSDSVAADGAKIDFAGGTATETNFRAQVTAFDSALALSTQLDDLTDVASIATLTGNGVIEVHGSFEPGSDGTFVPRFAQAAHTAGTLTRYRGSYLLMWDMP